MAIVTENYELNGRQFIRTRSDAHRYVVRDGVSYSEANDPAEFGRTYTEGDIIEDGSETESEEAQALTRYANELTGANDQTLTEAAETMCIKLSKEDI